jgi:mannosyltransferase
MVLRKRHISLDVDALPWAEGVWLTAVVLLGSALRLLSGLAYRSLWLDEIATVTFVSSSFSRLITLVLMDAVHPPLYYFCVFCIVPWGQSEFWLRFPSIVFGVLAIPLTYQLGKACYGRTTGILAAFLLAINPFHIWYSQESRMYSLLLCLTVAVGYFFVKTLQTGGLKWWAALVISSSLAYFTHYFALLLPASQFVFLVVTLRRRPIFFRKWVVAQFIAFLPLVPWLYLLFHQEVLSFGTGWLPAPTLLSPILTFQGLGMGVSDKLTMLGIVGLPIMLLAVVLGLASARARAQDSRLFLALWLVVPFVVVLLASLQRVLYYHRYFIIVLPALLILMSAGATCLRSKYLRALVTLALVGITLLSFRAFPDPATLPQQDWKGVAQYVGRNAAESDTLLVDGVLEMLALRRYESRPMPIVIRQLDPITNAQRPLDSVYQPNARLWMITRHVDAETAQWLSIHSAELEANKEFAGISVILLSRRPR